jgi:tRNA threonylcarbamoyladenosine modification (KEOPS) complex Cgi121 subunit
MVHTAGLKGTGWYVAVGGFRDIPAADVDELLTRMRRAAPGSTFQLFDADRVAGWRHLFFAAVNAVRAFEGGSSISRSLAVEALLYASCQDQITQAFDIMGLSSKTGRAALLVLAGSPEEAKQVFERISRFLGTADDSVLLVDEDKFAEIKRVLGVSDPELEAVCGPRFEALTKLVVERGALLSIRR